MNEEIPIMSVGKYKNVRMDAIPAGYLRWLCTQPFPQEILDFAMKKLRDDNTTNIQMEVTRHAYDRFSLRFMNNYFNRQDKAEGIGSYFAREANEAYEKGKDVSKHRHDSEQITKVYKGIKWVFNKGGSIRCLITIMD